jgi:pyruvate dehydrogenase E1 component alpha subunit
MATALVDGNDVEAVYDAAAQAVVAAREGGGPTFIECKTYRHRGHSRTDPAKYRDPAEVEAWMKRDPLVLYRAELVAAGLLDDDEADQIVSDARAAAKSAADRAAAAPWPSPTQDFMARTFA